ncbi:uncharacterized protein [Nothobranchius furzeri]|uniref:uncharacterized protein isoform X4 n=1 Tax=Nothobranchius furzeri TaxID=105023 RepID=UPI003904A5AB
MDTDVHQRVKEEASEDQSAVVDQQDSEKFHIKEEQEELRTSLEEEQLHLKEENNPARFPVTPVSIKSRHHSGEGYLNRAGNMFQQERAFLGNHLDLLQLWYDPLFLLGSSSSRKYTSHFFQDLQWRNNLE